jgi:hypothetical protein
VAEPWEETVGQRPHTVWVGERKAGGNVYVRWTVGRTVFPRSLSFKVRDERGRERKTEQKKARGIAERLAAALREGRDPTAVLEEALRPDGTSANAPGAAKGSFLSLKEALDRALKVGTGMYVVDDSHTRAMRRAAELLKQALGPGFSMGELTSSTAETVWRHVLKEASTRGKEPNGHGAAEKAIVLLYNVAGWIHRKTPKEAPNTQPEKGWKSKLRADWEKAFKQSLPDAKALRYSRKETAALFANLHRADPRVQLALQLGAELRAGQVARSMRSHLDLNDVRPYDHGTFKVEGRGKKHGELVHLTPAQRTYVDHCLGPEGHLHELEQAYQSGRIADYHLWQKGKMRHGRIPLERHLDNPGPMDPGSLIDLFKEYEAAIGIPHMRGRDFHGIRRVMSDIAEDYTGDSRELDRLTGHAASGTRSKVYQDRHKEEFREGAAEVRARMRADLEAGHRPPKRRGRAAPLDDPASRLREELAADGLPPERIEWIVAMLRGPGGE